MATNALANDVSVNTVSVNGVSAKETRIEKYDCAVSILRGALKTETGFKKVHAAEELIWCGYPQGVESAFQEELRTKPESIIGVWRVMAQLPSSDEANRATYLRKIYALLPDAKDLELLRTLESLGKLHFAGRPPIIRRFAEEKVGRPAAFARWILANSGEARDEMRLAGLLAAPNAATRSTTAYALRWLPSLLPGTVQRLRVCADEEAPSLWRASIWSAWYVHAPQGEKAAAKARLLTLLSGTNGEKYEIGQVLALRGGEDDLPIVEKLLADPEIDVRVSAAYALIQIDRRSAGKQRSTKLTAPKRVATNRLMALETH